MPQVPILALQFDCTFGFPVLVGSRIEWRDATWLDLIMVLAAAALLAF